MREFCPSFYVGREDVGSQASLWLCQVSFWNWNLAPQTTPDGATEHLTKDFTFMPEVWGANVVNAEWVREAGAVDFWDSNGKKSPAQMANIFMGMNEPDIQGSCMGDMFGTCTRL